jgi:hypothetical protein
MLFLGSQKFRCPKMGKQRFPKLRVGGAKIDQREEGGERVFKGTFIGHNGASYPVDKSLVSPVSGAG